MYEQTYGSWLLSPTLLTGFFPSLVITQAALAVVHHPLAAPRPWRSPASARPARIGMLVAQSACSARHVHARQHRAAADRRIAEYLASWVWSC